MPFIPPYTYLPLSAYCIYAIIWKLRSPPLQHLTLARRPLVRGDAVPLVDLRLLGAPIAPYACKVHRLLVNGREVPLSRTCVAVLDTGTTGMVVSDSLYGSPELPLPGAAMKQVVVEVLTERGRVVRFSADKRGESTVLVASNGEAPASRQNFPLIVTPVAIPWFSRETETFHRRRSSQSTQDAQLVESELGSAPHVLFLGLAFMADMRLTIDMDAQRLSALRLMPPRGDPRGVMMA